MRVIAWAVLLSLASACAGRSTASAPVCVLDVVSSRIAVAQPRDLEINEFYELEDSPRWWAPAPNDGAPAQFMCTCPETTASGAGCGAR